MDLLSYIGFFIHLLPILVYIIFYNRNKNKFSKTILIYCIYSIINEVGRNVSIISHLIPESKLVDILFLSSFTIVEFIFFSYYLYALLKNKKFKLFLLFASIFFLIVASINLFNSIISSSTTIDAIPISVSSIILIIASILYLFESIQNPEVIFVYSKQSFWITIGIMIYFSGTFFLFLQYESLSFEDKDNFWVISIICFVLKNIFFSISFTLKPENQQTLNVDEYYFNKLE